MRRILYLLPTLILCVSCSLAREIPPLERSVVHHAEQNPDTAYEYFLERIEDGASPENQAVYLYGMGRTNEAKGNVMEAINDHMAAEILGNESATYDLIRLRKKQSNNHQLEGDCVCQIKSSSTPKKKTMP